MSDLADLERRLFAALERIGKGLDILPTRAQSVASAPAVMPAPMAMPPQPAPATALNEDKDADIARLKAALRDQTALTGQLQDRLRLSRDRDGASNPQLEQKLDRMTRQLDVQGIELQRMRKTAITLREQLRVLRETQMGAVEPQMINKALLAEIEALRATRLTEMAEMDDILAELTPLIEEAEHA